MYQNVSLFTAKFHYIEFWASSYTKGGCPTKHIFSQNVQDGEQNLLLVLNLIYGAHNGRGVGLPDWFLVSRRLPLYDVGVANYTLVFCLGSVLHLQILINK